MTIKYKRLKSLSERIWKYLNGRYESFDKETTHIADMIEKELTKEATSERDALGWETYRKEVMEILK